MYTRMYVYMHMYIRMYVYMHACMYVCVCLRYGSRSKPEHRSKHCTGDNALIEVCAYLWELYYAEHPEAAGHKEHTEADG